MERIHCEHCGDNYRQRGFENVSDQQTHLSNWQSESLLQDSPPKLDDDPPKLEDPKPEPPKPEELCPRDPDEKPPPPPRPPANGLPLLSGEHPSAKGSPVCPGGQEHSTCPRPLFWWHWHWWNYTGMIYLAYSPWTTWTRWTGWIRSELREEMSIAVTTENEQTKPVVRRASMGGLRQVRARTGDPSHRAAAVPLALNQLYVPALSQPPTILGKLSSSSGGFDDPGRKKENIGTTQKNMWFCIHQSRYAWRLRMY